ncbi:MULTISPECIES: helix-turn-helix transcriptional regulator [Propionibacteriaceae]|jgi:predicted ArsR family transcriptional regulator|uniref:ArsR family transcriptional regulator n=2 Tax=Acidipropionibacterium TaxID=1912215 RepID=A0A3Q9ULL4_9ACTN|nr:MULTISPECIES: ArsR family transcriptional regulator [Propionibacteriaceae]AFV88081.1 Transcriptional regulator, ArsR family [Acidipropionibacterium acidipropionici ATCC 4875]AJQ91977.1 Transcriptional regulator, ArsR family [Propionibacterium freudenreichii subsp. freudenreichii]ALN14557.1 ArsR family transcriptional regulator [Acidipropionibacterium acidipropionici]APZ09685.1 ArsR family transcriptional regulator [Acidipropionibacterium acidipropionici]AZZ40260.1 ArsR family transcriptiona
MTENQHTLTDPGADSPADRVVEALRRRGGTASAAEVGADLGIHVSTARFHLDHLVEDGRARSGREKRATRGRPRTMFTLTPDPKEGPRAYQMLAGVLVDHLSRQDDAVALAHQAGVEWGRRYAGVDVTEILEQIGFAPCTTLVDDDQDEGPDGEARIALRHCPFIDVVQEHAALLCPLHRGVVEGVVGHPVTLEAHPGATCYVDLEQAG